MEELMLAHVHSNTHERACMQAYAHTHTFHTTHTFTHPPLQVFAQQDPLAVFKAFDRDGSGSISLMEWLRHIEEYALSAVFV